MCMFLAAPTNVEPPAPTTLEPPASSITTEEVSIVTSMTTEDDSGK